MKNLFPMLLACALCSLFASTPDARAQGTQFTYQGRLDSGGSPVNGSNDLTFTLYNAASGGATVGTSNVFNDLLISNGLFTLTLDFGAGAFDGSARWLEIAARPGASTGAYTNLAPRQPVTPTPYAIFAGGAAAAGVTGTLPAGVLSGAYSGSVNLSNAANNFAGNGRGLTNLSTTNLVGTLADARLSTNVALRAGGNTFNGTQIITNGNVGIGTANPGNKLTVSGEIGLFGSGLDGSTFQRFVMFADTANGLLFDGAKDSSNNKLPYHFNWRGGNPATDAMTILGNGNVGIGTATPSRLLHLRGSGIGIRFEDSLVANSANNNWTIDTSAFDTGNLGILKYENGSAVEAKSFFFNPSGNVGIGKRDPATKLDVVGEVTMTACNITSDRNAKEKFVPVNAREVLDKVARLPITEWQYKAHGDARHIGPMAQDFHAAFGTGRDEKHITTVDADGVALAAIQGLNEKLEEKSAEVEALKQSVAELKALVKQLTQPAGR